MYIPNQTLNNKKINNNKFDEKYVVMYKIDRRGGGSRNGHGVSKIFLLKITYYWKSELNC